eukprot:2366173-Lingulodinium_polyedra.AAC.1
MLAQRLIVARTFCLHQRIGTDARQTYGKKSFAHVLVSIQSGGPHGGGQNRLPNPIPGLSPTALTPYPL